MGNVFLFNLRVRISNFSGFPVLLKTTENWPYKMNCPYKMNIATDLGQSLSFAQSAGAVEYTDCFSAEG